MRKTINIGKSLFVLCLVTGIGGCAEERVAVAPVVIDIPGEFTSDGTQWQKKEMGPTEEKVLSNFFSKNADLLGSPEFEGYPSVFVTSTDDVRFYWLLSTVDGCRWQRVEKQGGKFDVVSGTGNPFEQKGNEG